MEELNNISEAEPQDLDQAFRIPDEAFRFLDPSPETIADLANALSTDAATAVVNSETTENELEGLPKDETENLFDDIRLAVKKIIFEYFGVGSGLNNR